VLLSRPETLIQVGDVLSEDECEKRSGAALAQARPALLRERSLPGAHAFLEIYRDLEFQARWIKPASGYIGNHIYVTDGVVAFDYHGLTTEARLLSLAFRRGRRFFPGWEATLVDLPADVLVSEARSRTYEGLWLREPNQFLYDAMPRARVFVQRFGDLRRDIVDLRDRLNTQQA
jgi:hypothetical protein